MKPQKKFWIVVTAMVFITIGAIVFGNSDFKFVKPQRVAATLPEVEIADTSVLAFPGADGFGRFATGGRGGRVIYVTNLNDSGSGSLRDAIEQTGKRIVLFNVSGNIELKSTLQLKNGDLTIAGQSAPGDGICIKNYPVFISAKNVVVRFLRFRMGDMAKIGDDAIGARHSGLLMVDHCSMSWSTDECASFYGNSYFTLQWCIVSESLRSSVHVKGDHGYGGIWGGHKASFHHNLLAHHDSRNPRFGGSRYTNRPDLEQIDFRNNVIYNWGINSGYAGEGGTYNIINNYYKPGPATKKGVKNRIFAPNADDGSNAQSKGVWGVFYVAGNFVDGDPSVTSDNWKGIHPDPKSTEKKNIRSNNPFVASQIHTDSAVVAYNKVLNCAGASFRRDSVDARIVRETKLGTFTFNGSKGSSNGLIDSQKDVGGWPELKPEPAPIDTDADGMPDTWETAHELNSKDAADGSLFLLDTHYTNVEVYLNQLVADVMPL
jgi:hypothetical protein